MSYAQEIYSKAIASIFFQAQSLESIRYFRASCLKRNHVRLQTWRIESPLEKKKKKSHVICILLSSSVQRVVTDGPALPPR